MSASPENLPKGWTYGRSKSRGGKIYYINEHTSKSVIFKLKN